ncbi:MAG TPA: SDR family NAD(P)-dependent oxidoreductase [Polyangiaceae bacterium]
MQLTGNTILITGGTSGIGRALAEAFHQRDNQVIIAGRRQALLDEISDAHPGMQGMPLDADDPRAIEVFAREVHERFPRLNVLINNAGISRPEDFTAPAIDLSAARSIIQTNILGVLELTAALLPVLKRHSRNAETPELLLWLASRLQE